MDKITIYARDGITSVTMPRCRPVLSLEDESITATMASGKTVRDVIGFRPNVRAVWDWVPAETVKALNALLRQGGFFQVTYPTPDGEKTEAMSVPFPAMDVFAYRNGVPMWHNITLTMEAQEVTRYAGG